MIAQDPCKGSCLWNHIIKCRGVLWKGIGLKIGRSIKVYFLEYACLDTYSLCKDSRLSVIRNEMEMQYGCMVQDFIEKRSLA